MNVFRATSWLLTQPKPQTSAKVVLRWLPNRLQAASWAWVLMVRPSGGLNQRLSAANGRAASARASATAETMRMANLPSQEWQVPATNSGYLPATLAAGVPAGLDPAVAAQARNKAFMKEAADNGYLPELLKPKLGEFELTAGSVIPAVMLSGINSDLPGTIVAQTRQTVYATNEPDAVVIPQGSRLIGRYSADVALWSITGAGGLG
jgi:type IV secretory pathway VirB10-like protein